ncbi:MAG: hypothetical protein ACOYMG_24130 [Candidatus Methylumidiphilus sp.]
MKTKCRGLASLSNQTLKLQTQTAARQQLDRDGQTLLPVSEKEREASFCY